MPSRLICTVLREMRACYETRDFSQLLSLVEEAQIMADRMEAALQEQHDIEWKREEIRELKKTIRTLKIERNAAEEQIEQAAQLRERGRNGNP